MGEHLTKNNIDKLTSKIMYSKFEDGENGCEDIPFYSSIKEELQRYQMHDLHRISDKIVKALCFIYNRKRNRPENFEEELCSYLYYWLGDIIYPKVKSQAVFSYIIKMIYTELYSNIRDDFIVCKNVYTPIDQDRFNKNKVLFDYSKDYKNIDLDTVYGDITCDNVYKEYITKYINMYKEAYSDCYETKGNKFDCDTFSKLFNNDQHTKLISFRCTESKNPSVALKVQGPTSQVPERTVQLRPAVARDSYMISRSEVLTGSHQKLSSPVTNILNEVESHSIDNTTEGGSSKTIAGSVVPVLGVSSISLLLYKVTPLGGFINRLLGRNRNMYNPMEYIDGFNPYNEGMDPGGRTMNISYHRL